MARFIAALNSSSATLSQTGLAALSFFLCAFALSLCASHSRRWRRWSASRGNNDLIIQQQFHDEGMMFSPTEAAENQQVSGPVWQKNILMGGKCQLPDFSGVIIYDSAGNAVTSNKPSRLALPWK